MPLLKDSVYEFLSANFDKAAEHNGFFREDMCRQRTLHYYYRFRAGRFAKFSNISNEAKCQQSGL